MNPLPALVLGAALGFGYSPVHVDGVTSPNEPFIAEVANGSYWQDVELYARWGALRAYTGIKTYDTTETGLSWYPFRSDYRIGASLTLGALVVGIEHECDHPVVSRVNGELLGPSVLGQRTDIYAKLTFEKEVK